MRILSVCVLMGCVATGLAQAHPHEVASWGSSQQVPEPQNALPAEATHDETLRQIVHLSIGGSALRVRLSNVFGTEPLHITSVHVARALSPASSEIDPKTDVALSFDGGKRKDITIPAGAEYVSDEVVTSVEPKSDWAVSIHYDALPAQQTGHPGSRSTTYFVHGDQTATAHLESAGKVDHWYMLSEIDVEARPDAEAVVALGDSITDGHAATTNGNDRWTDVLAARLQATAAYKRVGVVNRGTGGNHILTDGLGPNAMARFDRDVLATTGARWLIVFEGVNDLGALSLMNEQPDPVHEAKVAEIIGAMRQMVERAHAHGLRVYGATITPFVGSGYYHPASRNEQDRQEVNAWIRAAGNFDAVIDFDRVIRDPEHPEKMRLAYDSGDHLHPSPAGYKALGDSIPLILFAR